MVRIDLSRPKVFLKTRFIDKGAKSHVLEIVLKRVIAHISEAEQTTTVKDNAFTNIMRSSVDQVLTTSSQYEEEERNVENKVEELDLTLFGTDLIIFMSRILC